MTSDTRPWWLRKTTVGAALYFGGKLTARVALAAGHPEVAAIAEAVAAGALALGLYGVAARVSRVSGGGK